MYYDDSTMHDKKSARIQIGGNGKRIERTVLSKKGEGLFAPAARIAVYKHNSDGNGDVLSKTAEAQESYGEIQGGKSVTFFTTNDKGKRNYMGGSLYSSEDRFLGFQQQTNAFGYCNSGSLACDNVMFVDEDSGQIIMFDDKDGDGWPRKSEKPDGVDIVYDGDSGRITDIKSGGTSYREGGPNGAGFEHRSGTPQENRTCRNFNSTTFYFTKC